MKVDTIGKSSRTALARPRKKSWGEMSSAQRAALVALAVAELVLTGVAARDLAHRRPADVRGPRAVWAVVLSIQPVGPPLYLALGRRRSRAGDPPESPVGD